MQPISGWKHLETPTVKPVSNVFLKQTVVGSVEAGGGK